MKKIIFLSLYLFCGITILNAQTKFDNYTPLTASGKIPSEFLMTSKSKYEKDVKKLKTESKSRKETKILSNFSLESNFVLDNLLQSGSVLFNDKVTQYLEKVLNKVNNKNIANVKVYALRSDAVNAFASPRGEIFVTLGLLAQLENEAQLAFILAHELTHIKEKHALEILLDTEGVGKSSSDKQLLKKVSFDDKILKKCHYTRELEKKADEGGLDLIKNSAYDLTDLHEVFDVLKYAYLPYDEIKFMPALFESESYKLPNTFILEKPNPINTEEKEDDTKSTHPSIKSRRAFMIDKLKTKNSKDKKIYLVSEAEFNDVRELARFELPFFYLRNEEYPEAFYTSFLLLDKHPNNLFAKKCIAKSLYFQAKYKSAESESETVFTEKGEKLEGELHAVHYFFDKMKAKDLSILATRWIWNLYMSNPEDNEIKQMAEGILKDVNKEKLTLNDFVTAKKMEQKEAAKTDKKDDKKDKSKSEKSKKIAQTETKKNDNNYYWATAFDVFLNEKMFKDAFEAAKKKQKEEEDEEEFYKTEKGKSEFNKFKSKGESEGLKMGIDKVVVVNPFYLKLDARQKNTLEYIGTEDGQAHFSELIQEVADKKGLNIDILNVANLGEKDIEKFNDIRTLNEYFGEQFNRSEVFITPSIDQQKVDALAQKYGTKYFLLTGVVSLRESNTKALLKLGLCIIIPYFLPFAIYDLAKPDYDMLQYAILYDVTSGKRQVIKYDYFNHRDNDAIVKAHIYDTFNQINKKR